MCVIRVLPHVETYLDHEVTLIRNVQEQNYRNRKASRLIDNHYLCSKWRIEDRTNHRQRQNNGFRSFTHQRQICWYCQSYYFFLHFDI